MTPAPRQLVEKPHATGVQVYAKGTLVQWLWDKLPNYASLQPDPKDEDAIFHRRANDDNNDNRGGRCLQCTIRDNNPRVHYEGQWTLSQDRLFTTHSTTTPDSTVSLTFNGTGITVFGTVPSSNFTRTPPTVVYRIDSSESVMSTQPIANKNVRKQPLFSHTFGSQEKEHEIIIRFLRGNAPFILENFFIFPQQDDTMTGMDGMENMENPSAIYPDGGSLEGDNTSNDVERIQEVRNAVKIIRILSGILGGILFCLVIFLAFKLWRRYYRRRCETLHRKQPSLHATESLYTHFTGTDTILRYTPPNILWPSHFSRSEGRRSSSIAKSSMMPDRYYDMMPSITEPPLPPPKAEIDNRLPRYQTAASQLSCPQTI